MSDEEDLPTWYDSFVEYESALSEWEERKLIDSIHVTWNEMAECLFLMKKTSALVIDLCLTITNSRTFRRNFHITVEPIDDEAEENRIFQAFRQTASRVRDGLKNSRIKVDDEDRIANSDLRRDIEQLLATRPQHRFIVNAYRSVIPTTGPIEVFEQLMQNHESAAAGLFTAHSKVVQEMVDHFIYPIVDPNTKLEAAKFGFAKAIARYDPKRGYRLWPYAVHWVAQAIQRSAEK